MLDDAFSLAEIEAASDTQPGTWEPSVDLVETDRDFVALVELPGLNRESVDLELDGSRLILSGQRVVEGGGQFQLMERSHGPFRRVFELGQMADRQGISAKFRAGVLTIRIPKIAERRIEVE